MRGLLALIIFAGTYLGIASERVPRHAVALFGALMLMVTGILPLDKAIEYVNWDTIGLLLGMFLLITVLADAGFFQVMAARVAAFLKYNPARVIVAFPLLAGFMAAFMDSITVILFLSALSLDLCKLLKLDPVPLVIAEVCAANAGGASTLVGDPPNVILGTMLGFTFGDFATNTGPIALACLDITVVYFRLLTRATYPNANMAVADYRRSELARFEASYRISDPRMLRLGVAGLGTAVFLLIAYRHIDARFHAGISPAVASLVPALAVLLLGGEDTKEVFHKIDGESLLFFIALFMVIGGLEETGIIAALGRGIGTMVGGRAESFMAALTWIPGIASGVVDNVPLAVAMGYLARSLAARPGKPPLALMTWAIALGVDIGGNLTPIGASANVVGYAALERRGYKVGWGCWIAQAVPPTLLSMALCSLVLALRAR